jgi:hypothetical protein
VDAIITDPPYCSGAVSEASRTRATGQGVRTKTGNPLVRGRQDGHGHARAEQKLHGDQLYEAARKHAGLLVGLAPTLTPASRFARTPSRTKLSAAKRRPGGRRLPPAPCSPEGHSRASSRARPLRPDRSLKGLTNQAPHRPRFQERNLVVMSKSFHEQLAEAEGLVVDTAVWCIGRGRGKVWRR